MTETKERLDVLLVKKGLAESREKAKALILAGNVYVNEKKETKAKMAFSENVSITIKGEVMKYVSRGGYKLEKAIEKYGVSVKGKICMDVGASTGGFTDCMLQNGAKKVYAVDVGTDQLAKKLREDLRVISMEQTNIRYLKPEEIEDSIEFISIDVAFISLTKVLMPVRTLLRDDGEVICLIKPQFEAGRERVGKKGVVKDKNTHVEVIEMVVGFARQIGFVPIRLDYSPIKGPEGNIEYLLHLKNVVQEPIKAIDSITLERIKDCVKQAHNGLKD
ncbi:MAG: TlyA family RNA methyltransferase [Lachnospiraceae bacterium]|nr:TlyA family RNA methyltransferase [Lachnospiraceae bacterium]